MRWAGMLDAVDDEGLLLTSRRAAEPFLARPANLPLAGAWATRDVCEEVDAGFDIDTTFPEHTLPRDSGVLCYSA